MAGSSFARELRKESTWAEKLMWRWLRDRRLTQYKFRRQYPIGIYFLDFYCVEAKLSIELDGSQHGFPDVRWRDERRGEFLKKKGIKELRFWNSQLANNPQAVRVTIFNELQARAPHALPSYIVRPGPHPEGEGDGKHPGLTADPKLKGAPLSPSPSGRGPG